ncbi:hypothetical protein BC826DRAFT_1177047 [Russula brevipes]|nr:hypothetical protein BC826DRAFT_1177047 [Russula brevipes]
MWPSARPSGECECTNGAQNADHPPSPGRRPFTRGPRFWPRAPWRHDDLLPRRLILNQDHGLRPFPGPRPCAVRRLLHSRRARNRAPNRWGPSSSASRLKSSGSAPATICLHRATIRDSLARTAASTALPVQRKRRRVPRCQHNANGGERRAANATRTAASTAQPVQSERRRTPRSQSNANGGEHRAASATRTAASTALPVQRKRQRAPRCQRNANGGERHAASATRTAAGTVAPALSHSRCSTHFGDLRPAREQRAEPRALMSFSLRRLFTTACPVYTLNKVTTQSTLQVEPLH